MANSVIKAERQDSGSTNEPSVTWTRYGKIVIVTAKDAPSVPVLTGLPTPQVDYLVSPLIIGTAISGFIRYNGSWSVNNGGYGNLTYTCAD